MYENSEKVLNKWLELANNGNLEALLALYDDNATILPTFSDSIKDTEEKRRDYFNKLLSRKGIEISIHSKSIKTQKPNDGIGIITGLYCWRYMIENEKIAFEARFTFVLDLQRLKPIIHHHSSQIPRGI